MSFPLDWLLAHGSGPLRARALLEVARVPGVTAAMVEPMSFTHRGGLLLALRQGRDGLWGDAMLTVAATGKGAATLEGVGTIQAVRRLVELGWSKDTPPLYHARRILFRLLAEDDEPALLFELASGRGESEEMVQRGRAILREAAAAVLAQAGYESDPRLRGAARRIIDRVGAFLRSPMAAKPFVRQGNQHVLPAEATPPSIWTLVMLAHMPLFRTEHYDTIERLYNWVSQPLPRAAAMQVVGTEVVEQPHLVLGNPLPHANAVDADIPFALMWLETMARMGYLKRNEGWLKLFDRFLADRDDRGVWHPHKTGGSVLPSTTSPFAWGTFPLEDGTGAESKFTDVTFRIGLIARLLGREIVLGR